MELIILVITCIINIVLGAFVLMHDPKSTFARSFAVMSLIICVWIVSNFITDTQVGDVTINSLANNIAYASGYGIVISGLVFSYFFPVKRRVNPNEILVVVIMSAIVVGLSFTQLIAGEVSLSASGTPQFTTGPLILVYILGYVGVLGLIVRNSVVVSHHWDKSRKIQARLVLVAFCFSALIGLLLNAIIPLFAEEWRPTRFGPLATLFLVATIVYAIARHGLFDVKQAVVRTSAYVFSLATLAGLYYVIIYALSVVIANGQSVLIQQSPLTIALALVIAFLFQPIKQLFDRITNAVFYKDTYSTSQFFTRLNRIMTSTMDLSDLLHRSADEIASTLKVEQAFFIVHRHNDSITTVGTEHHSRFPFADSNSLDAHVLRFGDKVIVASAMPSSVSGNRMRKLMISHKVEVVLPLVLSDKNIGYLCLGEQKSSRFTKRDTTVLETAADELTVAIQNALVVQELRDLNDTLQQRVANATKELRGTNAVLRRLDEAKDEFVSMASHQLRTPLTSVKGYISMVLEGDAGKITVAQKQLLEEAFNSSERMVRLISDFLNVSRLQTGKFIVDAHAVNLAKIVSQELDSLTRTASTRGLKFRYKVPTNFPLLNLDEGKIRQVIMNFSDNALYYSKDKSIIKVELKRDKSDIMFTVQDSGIGVPELEQARLFNKFYRASNARKQRPDGTGVGLFLAKKVIDAHGGRVIFESIEGKGSTFGFRLPLEKLRAVKDAN